MPALPPVRCRSEACHEAKGWASQFRQRHLAAARTSNVFSTLCGWRHIFKTSETLFQSVRDSIQFTDWDPFQRLEPARMSGKEDQREDRDEQAEQTLETCETNPATRAIEIKAGSAGTAQGRT